MPPWLPPEDLSLEACPDPWLEPDEPLEPLDPPLPLVIFEVDSYVDFFNFFSKIFSIDFPHNTLAYL